MNKAQKTDVTIPIAKVIPNPLTGPVPNQINIDAVMRVVRLASIIVENAFAYPPSNAFTELFPARNSSNAFENKDIRIYRHSNCQDKSCHTWECKGCLKRPANIAITNKMLVPTDSTATIPPALYHVTIKAMTSTAPKRHAFKLLDKAPAARVGEISYFSQLSKKL